MSLTKTWSTARVRLLAAGLCVIALSLYFTSSPRPSAAEECCDCVSANVHYSEGDCKGGALCVCLYDNATCLRCVWDQNNINCRPLGD